MRLSEAIRLGSMMGPQAHGNLSQRRRKYIFFGPIITEYCALGAAHAAVGARLETRIATGTEGESIPFRGKAYTRKAGQKFTVLVGDNYECDPSWQVVGCPACTKVNGELFRVIPHLNDGHRWTREQIADFVAAFEPTSPVDAVRMSPDQPVAVPVRP